MQQVNQPGQRNGRRPRQGTRQQAQSFDQTATQARTRVAAAFQGKLVTVARGKLVVKRVCASVVSKFMTTRLEYARHELVLVYFVPGVNKHATLVVQLRRLDIGIAAYLLQQPTWPIWPVYSGTDTPFGGARCCPLSEVLKGTMRP